MGHAMIKARIAEQDCERRSAARLPVSIQARMRELGTMGVEAKILNFSETGFMAVADARFEVGARIWLILPGRERANAVVKWTAGDRLGAEFNQPLSAASLASINY